MGYYTIEPFSQNCKGMIPISIIQKNKNVHIAYLSNYVSKLLLDYSIYSFNGGVVYPRFIIQDKFKEPSLMRFLVIKK